MEISNETKEPAMSAKSVNHKDKKHKSPKAFRRKSLKSLGNFMNRILKTLSTLAQVGDVEQPDAEEDDGGFRDSAARALSAGSGIYQDDFPGGREHLKNSATLSSQGSIKGRLSWCYGDKTPGVQGLKNHGNTCFMNAVIQCLSNTDLLAEYLGLEQYKSDLFNQRRLNGVVRNEDLHSAKGEVTEHLASLVRALWTLEYTPQLSVDFKSIVSKYGSQFRGNSQHDALEFLLWLLDRVHEDANTSSTITNGNNPSSAVTNGMSNSNRATVLNTGPPETQPAGTRHSFVQEHFQAQYRSSLTCPHCLKQSNTFDPFLCISLPIPLRQTRAVNVTLVFNSKALRYMRVGLAVPLLGSVSALRALLAQEGNISPEQVILVELYSSGFQRSFSDDDDMTSIAETDVIYAFQAPPPFSRGSSSRYSGFHRSLPSSPHTAGPEGQRSLASGTLSSEFLNQGGSSSILLLVCNTAGSGQHAARFGLPFLMHEERGVSWTELQQNILSKLYYLMVCGTPAQNAGVLFRIRVVGGSASCSYLSPHDSMPLCHPAVDRALKLCGPGGPLHVKLVMEWDADVKERLFGSIQEEVVKDAESVREQQHNHLQQHSCTLDECFQLYTKEEQLAPDDAWRCPHCRQLQQGMVKMSLWTLPDILILHLKRFRQVADRRNKLSTLVRFPPHGLDMAPHVAKRGQGSQRSLAPWPPGWEHGDADFLYDLYAVCNHHGGMHGGHYTAYCRNSVDGQWYGFDDSSVDLIPEEELCTRGAYILFYQRRNAIPPWSASSSLRGSISSSVSDHWLVRLTEDSVRGSVSSRLSASYPPTSPVTPVTPDGPDSPRLPAFGGDAQRNDSGGFETRPLVRSLQNRSASVRSPTKARDTLRKMLPLRWSLGSKDRRKPAPTPVPVPAPTPTPDPVPVPAATPAPAQLVEYLESGRRPRCTNDNIITLMTSSSSKGAAVGQKAASAPQVAEGQQRPASEPGPAQRGSSSGSLPRRSSRRTRQDQAKGQAGGRIGRASETHPADRAESRGDDPKAQDSIVTYLRGSLNRRDVARASGEVEPRPQTTRGGRSLPRMSLPSGSQGRVPGRKTNGVAQPEPHPGAELANGRAVGGGAGDIKRSQSSSSIPRRAEGDMRHTTSLQPSSGSGPRQSMGGERSPRGSLQRARYSSSASLGRRRAVPESSF